MVVFLVFATRQHEARMLILTVAPFHLTLIYPKARQRGFQKFASKRRAYQDTNATINPPLGKEGK